MTTVMVADFSGMLPIRDPLLLPDNNAQYAENAWLYLGQVRGLRHAMTIFTTAYADTASVYRIPGALDTTIDDIEDFINSTWLEFPDPYMSVIRNPTVEDQYKRYFFFPSDQYASTGVNPNWPATSPGPMYNTLDRIKAGQPAYKLGIPNPDVAPGVTPNAIPADQTRHYLYTWVDVLGVDSPPSPDNSADGLSVGTWTITVPPMITTGDTSQLSLCILYRSVLVGSALHYYEVFQFPVNATSYISFTDNYTDAQITGNKQLVNYDATLPQPTIAVGINAAEVPAQETRAYVYTYVSGFSEEGPPSPATVKDGQTTGTWVVTMTPPTAAQMAGRNLTKIRLYRTVTDANGNTVYYQVCEEPIGAPAGPPTTLVTSSASTSGGNQLFFSSTAGVYVGMAVSSPDAPLAFFNATVSAVTSTVVTLSTTLGSNVNAGARIVFDPTVTYNDSFADSDITANKTLDTVDYTAPPADLQGVVMMANGIAAGFSNEREVWFSAAYLPHAWPGVFALSVDYPIIGLTANGSSLNIVTAGAPSIATGVTPDTMTIGKIDANEPCIGRGSIVASGEGAYYASPNGYQRLSSSGTVNITMGMMEKEFWYSLQPGDFASGKFGGMLVSYVKNATTTDNGAVFATDLNEDKNVPFTHLHTRFPVTNIYNDELSGQIFYLSNGRVMQWNPPQGNPGTTNLWSYIWKSKKFRFTAPQQFKAFEVYYDIPPEVMITPGVRNTDQAQTYNEAVQLLIVRIYGDGNQLVVREIQRSGETLLIPGGSKWTLIEFQLEGQVAVKLFKMASSVKELKAA